MFPHVLNVSSAFISLILTGAESESSLGEYCGDEIKALEKKEYTDPAGEARVEWSITNCLSTNKYYLSMFLDCSFGGY